MITIKTGGNEQQFYLRQMRGVNYWIHVLWKHVSTPIIIAKKANVGACVHSQIDT